MQINFNGKTYNSLEEMPANERRAYEQLQKIFVDANGNGIPDFLEGDVAQKVITAFSSAVNYDGKVYNNLDELPPEIRQKVQNAFEKLNQMGILNSNPVEQNSSEPSSFEYAFQPSTPLIPKESTIAETNAQTSRVVLMLALVIVIVVLGAAVLFFLLVP